MSMPQADDDVTVLVCDCGKRLKAPGARPGRVGRCPACGSVLRFPGDERPASEGPPRPRAKPEVARPAEVPVRERPRARKADAPIRVGGSAPPEADASILPKRATTLDPEKRAALLDAARQVGRGGILRLPRTSAFGLKDALLYPIWDFAGLSWMLFLPFGLGISFLSVFFLIPLVLQGGNNAILGPFAFPMTIAFAFAMGYLGLVLEAVVIESAAGEVHHPRWPEIEFGAIVLSLFRWACGLAIGLSLGAVPAIRYWQGAAEHGLAGRLVAAALVASGLTYGLMSMASLILHGALPALNPMIVLAAIFRAGFRYGQTVLLAVVFAMVGTFAIATIDRVSGALMLPTTWLAWAVIVYGALVVSRSLGMVCHTRRKEIGWFPDRPRWGASTDGIDPSIFRDKEGRRVE